LWDDLRFIDKTWERTNFIYTLILGVELAHQKNFKEAITGLERNFRRFKDKKPVPKYLKRRIAVNCLQKAVNEWDDWKIVNLRVFNNHFIKYLDGEYNIKIGAAISSGKTKEFAESWKCKDFAQCLKLKDDRNNIRTIHKAKGGEYDTVLVALEEESHLKYIINPDIDNEKDDECRLYYVALSRAKDNLFICTPTLSEENKEPLMALDILIS
jgi:DNA helicase II / ATP-dependent DNA helicase PcrA